METWKDIPGHEGWYQASSLGNIRGVDRFVKHGNNFVSVKGKVLAGKEDKGYRSLGITVNGVRRKRYIHQLVAMAFIDNPLSRKEINHINGIKHDNRPENLEWSNRSLNVKHSFDIGLNRKGGRHAYAKGVRKLSLSGEEIKTYDCISTAAMESKTDSSSISKCCKGIRSTAANFKWSYL